MLHLCWQKIDNLLPNLSCNSCNVIHHLSYFESRVLQNTKTLEMFVNLMCCKSNFGNVEETTMT